MVKCTELVLVSVLVCDLGELLGLHLDIDR